VGQVGLQHVTEAMFCTTRCVTQYLNFLGGTCQTVLSRDAFMKRYKVDCRVLSEAFTFTLGSRSDGHVCKHWHQLPCRTNAVVT